MLGQLSQAVNQFYAATTFTASEFGRTLQPNGSGGTDHAWGGHHFVVGGSVLGGKLYGQYPSLALAVPTTRTRAARSSPRRRYRSTPPRWRRSSACTR